MKRQIRKGVFETNSSSCHSICIATGLEQEELHFPDKVTFRYGEFGWEHKCLDTVEEKASYLYTAIYYMVHDSVDRWKECLMFIFETLKEYHVECSFEGYVKLEPWVSTYGDSPNLRFSVDIDYGYIDHSDATVDLVDALCSDKDLLLSYLFSSKSFILTGNDNSEEDRDVDIKVDYAFREFYKGN